MRASVRRSSQRSTREIDLAFERGLVEMQRAAMGRIEAGDRPLAAEPRRDQAPIGPALGAVAVQHVGRELGEMGEHVAGRRDIGERDRAAHRKSRRPEREARRHLGDDVVLEAAAGGRIADDADLVAGTAWASARSTMWRNMPPIGARTTWTIRSLAGRSMDASSNTALRDPSDSEDMPEFAAPTRFRSRQYATIRQYRVNALPQLLWGRTRGGRPELTDRQP